MPSRETSLSTRKRLLESASEIFAEKGYRNATIAEICHKGQANVASVNYHFGDKKNLYDEVWRHAYALAAEAYPVPSTQSDVSPEERFRGYISACLRRIFSAGAPGHFARFLAREMAEPTHASETIFDEVLVPHREWLESLLEEMLGCTKEQEQFRYCLMSVMSQLVFPGFNMPLRERVFRSRVLDEEQIEELTEYLTRFSLAGIRGLQKECA